MKAALNDPNVTPLSIVFEAFKKQITLTPVEINDNPRIGLEEADAERKEKTQWAYM